jgi:hypothetical protein
MKFGQYIKEYNLLIYTPNGTMDLNMILNYYEDLNKIGKDKCLKRLINFNELNHISFGYKDMNAISKMRDYSQKEYTKNIKISLYATNPLAIGMANMIKVLLQKENYEIQFSRDLKEASKWLDVPEEILNQSNNH